ncbi:DNA-binding protein WhiA [Oscillospiraceae bacterium MB08-C2-2]|nr:DNA-binding protein WhiA [Oscillospiraceae bacterium MB08-C2-2]
MEPSFAYRLKNEMVENKAFRLRQKTAQAHGFFLFGRRFSREEISLHTEDEEIARLFGWFVISLAGKKAVVTRTRKKGILRMEVPAQSDRDKLVELFGDGEQLDIGKLARPEEKGAFLCGAFLACGNITDPQKSYHLEFVVRNEALCQPLADLLEECCGQSRLSKRRGLPLVYYKDCTQIEDLLAFMGAVKGSLEIVDIEILKNVRNQANRATNCETANIDKTVNAAATQIADISYILETAGENALPEALRQLAHFRLENPEMSLRDLAALFPGGLSRSGIHHRLAKISAIAEELRQK